MQANFTIPMRLPGLNEIIAGINRNRWAGNNLKQLWTKSCSRYILLWKVPKFTDPVTIHFDWYELNLRRDPGNIRAGEKFISDALVVTGVIQNDSQQHIKGLSDNFYLDRRTPRVEVTIETAYIEK